MLVTTFRTGSGVVELTDALAMGEGPHGHDLGAGAPHVLLRRARCLDGTVELALEFAPRFEYGLTHPLIEAVTGGVGARGGASRLVLASSLDMNIDDAVVRGRATLAADESMEVALQYESSWSPSPAAWSPARIAVRIDDTVAAWRTRQRRTSALRRAVRGPGRSLRSGPAGADLPTQRCDRRRSHDLIAGVGRWRTQLGLPLHVGT